MSQIIPTHRRTQSEPKLMPADPNPMVQSLLNLVTLVQSISNNDSFTDFEAFIKEFCSLKEKDQANMQKLQKLESELKDLKASNDSEVSELKNQHKLEYGKLLEIHHEKAAGMGIEKKRLEEKLDAGDRKIKEKDGEVSKLQKINSDLTLQAKTLTSEKEKLKEQLTKTQEEVKELLRKVDEKDDTIQKSKEKVARQGDVIMKHSSESSSLRADLRATRRDLKEVTEKLTKFRSFGVPLQDDNTAEVIQRFNDLWKHCLTVVVSCFETDLPSNVLQDTTALSTLRKNTYIQHRLPLPLSNSIAAKSMRSVVVLALISQILVDEVFKPTNLIQGDTELRHELCYIAQETPDKEAFIRALLISLHDPEYLNHHISKFAQLVYRQVTELLEPKLADNFRKDIQSIFQEAAGIWSDLQLMRSHFDIDLEFRKKQSGSWKSIKLSNTKLAFDEQDVSADGFESDTVELKVFPRMYIAGPQGETPVLSGRVLQRSQTTSAMEELANGDEKASSWESAVTGSDRRRQSLRRVTQQRQNGGAFLGSDIGQQKS